MKRRYKVIYKNASLKEKNGKERTLNIVKTLFWKEAPENWADFDGELSVEWSSSKGMHDCAIIEFSAPFWEQIIVKALNKRLDVYSIKKISDTQDY